MKILFLTLAIIGLYACWVVFKTEQGIRRLEKETGKSYSQLKAEFYNEEMK